VALLCCGEPCPDWIFKVVVVVEARVRWCSRGRHVRRELTGWRRFT
jgi:hypothetical protein